MNAWNSFWKEIVEAIEWIFSKLNSPSDHNELEEFEEHIQRLEREADDLGLPLSGQGVYRRDLNED